MSAVDPNATTAATAATTASLFFTNQGRQVYTGEEVLRDFLIYLGLTVFTLLVYTFLSLSPVVARYFTPRWLGDHLPLPLVTGKLVVVFSKSSRCCFDI